MPKPIHEATWSPIYGNDENNFIYIDGYTASNYDFDWSGWVVAWGGDDFIVLDAHIDWSPYFHPNGPQTIHFNGGNGNDTLSLTPTDYSITANLSTGEGTIHMPDYVFWQNGGWHSHPTSIPMEFISIENLFGGSLADHITGSTQANMLSGGSGDDKIWGLAGNDNLQGGHGHDEIWGGLGNDSIHGGDGWDHLFGDDGNDIIVGGDGIDMLAGGDGNDTLNGGDGDDNISGNDGQDILIGGVGTNVLDGGAGSDFVKYITDHDVIVNLLDGTGTSDTITDTLVNIEKAHTGSGDDVVYGDNGNNTIWLNDGNDWAFGYSGNDTIKGHDGHDRLFGENGNDSLWGGDGDDIIWGGQGIDVLHGGEGGDRLIGGGGGDFLYGNHGNDDLEGDSGNDELSGGNGNDTINGGDGEDIIDAGGHDDFIFVTDGLDLITTGSGSDTLFFVNGQSGLDYVTDFDVNQDYFAFEAGVFADDASLDLYNLAAMDDPHGNAILYVREDHITWQPLIYMYEVNANDINQRIQDGTIINPLPEVEGDFQFEKEVPVAPEFGDHFLM